ncbi:MAG: hypothetical protein MZV63_64615 [Marinilabiliales bacterium]|nr:hypothetical protein [Marinilabiliales bacterium]
MSSDLGVEGFFTESHGGRSGSRLDAKDAGDALQIAEARSDIALLGPGVRSPDRASSRSFRTGQAACQAQAPNHAVSDGQFGVDHLAPVDAPVGRICRAYEVRPGGQE